MKKLTNLLVLTIVASLTLGVISTALSAERMTYEEYSKKLQAYQDREAAARQNSANTRVAIDSLKAVLADLDKQIADTWDQVYAYLNTTREQVADFNKQLDGIDARLSELSRMQPDQLSAIGPELDAIDAKLAEMAKSPINKLTKEQGRVAALQQKSASVRSMIPKPKNDMYSVVRGDCLWRISGKKEIFGDPWKWLRIWSYNRSQIKDPDLIYPKQQFTIPRQLAKDEYLVVKGDNLKKIAARPEVYGDPFAWTKIYQANKAGGFIKESHAVYPEMILTIPRN